MYLYKNTTLRRKNIPPSILIYILPSYSSLQTTITPYTSWLSLCSNLYPASLNTFMILLTLLALTKIGHPPTHPHYRLTKNAHICSTVARPPFTHSPYHSLFGIGSTKLAPPIFTPQKKAPHFSAELRGSYRIRTGDPFHVKEVL
jgi:hypothetical protein